MNIRPKIATLGLLLTACSSVPRIPPEALPPASESERPALVRVDSLLGTAPRHEPGPVSRDAASTSIGSVDAHSPFALAPEGVPTTLAGRVSATRLASLNLDGAESVREVMRFLSAATGIDIFVEQQAEDAVLDAGIEFNIRRDRPIALHDALDLLVELAEREIDWTLRDGVVVVTTPDRARGAPKTVVYDVSDLVRGIQSYPGRRMDLAPSGGLVPFDEDLGDPTPVIDENMLIELIMNTIDPDGWDRPGNSVTIRGGKLIVTHD